MRQQRGRLTAVGAPSGVYGARGQAGAHQFSRTKRGNGGNGMFLIVQCFVIVGGRKCGVVCHKSLCLVDTS
jgi:hypothetical protein